MRDISAIYYYYLLLRTVIGAVPMVTMVQSAANWRNTHAHMGQENIRIVWHVSSHDKIAAGRNRACSISAGGKHGLTNQSRGEDG